MNRKELRDHKYKILFSTLYNDMPLKNLIIDYFSNLPNEEEDDNNNYTSNSQQRYVNKKISAGLNGIIIDDEKMMNDINDNIYEIELSLNDLISHIEDIDDKIEKALETWQKERLAKTELIILRLCLYEIFYMKTDIPLAVNESVLMAKEYGSDDKSYKFINGVIKTILQQNNMYNDETTTNSD